MTKEHKILEELREIRTLLEHHGMITNKEHKRIIANKLFNDGKSITDICKQLGITRRTFYNWKNQEIEANVLINNFKDTYVKNNS